MNLTVGFAARRLSPRRSASSPRPSPSRKPTTSSDSAPTAPASWPGSRTHDHRHTAAVHLAMAGMPLHLLQQQLGHKNIEITMKYSRFHPDSSDVAGYYDRVEAKLGLGNNNPDNTPEEEGARAVA